MNVQTERLENHTARLTVEIAPEQLEQAKQKAARDLSKRYRIPGFRPGKAPYKVLVGYVGEATVLESAVEALGDSIYKQALTESAVKPYGPGSLEDFKIEPPTFIFTVPLQPEIELNDYRTIREDYVAPTVTDKEFEEAMKALQQREALVEESSQPVVLGNRVTVDIHSHFTDGEEREDDDDEEEHDHDHDDHDHDDDDDEDDHDDDDDEEDDDDHDHDDDDDDHDHDHDDEDGGKGIVYKGDNFVHRHDAPVNLVDDAILPGFAEALVGATAGEERIFELTVPDTEEYKDVVGRKVEFSVTVKKIEVVTLPDMNDDFAARVTKDEDEPLTLLQLRQRMRENLQKEKEKRSEDEYANTVLDKIIAQSTIAYPDTLIAERIEDMLKDLDDNLRQQGLNLDYYQKATGTTKEQLYQMYQPSAEKSLKRSLVLGEIMVAEELTITDSDIDARLDEMLGTLPAESRESFRRFMNSDQQRSNILNNMLYERVMDCVVKIGKGEALDVVSSAATEAAASITPTAEATADAAAEQAVEPNQ